MGWAPGRDRAGSGPGIQVHVMLYESLPSLASVSSAVNSLFLVLGTVAGEAKEIKG